MNKLTSGAVSDFNGEFALLLTNISITDTLIISHLSYKQKKICVKDIDTNEYLIISLEDNIILLDGVMITARNPVSENFSVTKIDRLGIYLNPVSSGDPLKAITSMPSSTNTDETANPSLRGSSSDRSLVALNGVPVLNPVRNSRIDGIGNFSLFNTEIVDKQYVYASNPPLTYGNTTAGLVEIETKKEISTNQIQLSLGLANAGIFASQKLAKESFIQVYGNVQFSDVFLALNKKSLPRVNNFGSTDIGINSFIKLGKNITLNTFNYFIDEKYNVTSEVFSYEGMSAANKTRAFTVNQIKYFTAKGVFSFNNGIDYSNSNYDFGNLITRDKNLQLYNSLNYRQPIFNKASIQIGISYSFSNAAFKDSIPLLYFAFSPNSPNLYADTTLNNHCIEGYLYSTWDINKKLILSAAIRSNIPVDHQKFDFSSQVGLRYNIAAHHSMLLSMGKYYNYAQPYFYSYKYRLLSSYQIALDYTYEKRNTQINTAFYYKNESGEQFNSDFLIFDRTKIFGIELYFEQLIFRSLKFSLSNTYLKKTSIISGESYKGDPSLNYFIKTTLNYTNPRLFNLAITYITRPGLYYSRIDSSYYVDEYDLYFPVYTDINNAQYKSYNNISLTLTRYLSFKKSAFILFATLNNLLNTKNQNQVLYNSNFSIKSFDYYQLRSFYFGFVWQL
ncbi:MAG: hypothetical protein A2W85_17285 [Bacteroidetes bacterium GWF2_41_31]|nr:MAG: hypothetical protein A2W85_17285 [Bacteroidetes bacterium GWF2_41_31]